MIDLEFTDEEREESESQTLSLIKSYLLDLSVAELSEDGDSSDHDEEHLPDLDPYQELDFN